MAPSILRRAFRALRSQIGDQAPHGIQAARAGAITLGRHTYLSGGSLIKTWAPSEQIIIGSYCSIADEVRVLHPGVSETLVDAAGLPHKLKLRGNHRIESATTFPVGILAPANVVFDEVPDDGSLRSSPLVIGNDVWIGYRAMVLGPVTVGDGAVIGAGAVVVKDVPPYAIAVGNPARVVRYRLPAQDIEAMLRIRWWEWPEQLFMDRLELFFGPVSDFIAAFDPERGSS